MYRQLLLLQVIRLLVDALYATDHEAKKQTLLSAKKVYETYNKVVAVPEALATWEQLTLESDHGKQEK